MASEYLEWKYRDVKPDVPKQLTGREKAQNWWHYHKWHIVLGAVLLIAAVDIGRSALGIGEVRPDYQIAYVGTDVLPEDTVTALETALAGLGEDCNGDGDVVVQLNQYIEAGSANTENSDTAYYAYASEVTLMADLEDCESYFFILQDGETFQKGYQILSRLDGSLPDDQDNDFQDCYLRWPDCPILSGLELGDYTELVADQEVSGSNQELLSGMYFARRGFWGEKTCENVEGCEALWDKLTEGAKE